MRYARKLQDVALLPDEFEGPRSPRLHCRNFRRQAAALGVAERNLLLLLAAIIISAVKV